MTRLTERSAVIDALLDMLALGTIIGTTLVAPNLAQVFAKHYNKTADKRDREREARALLHYMKRQGVVNIIKADAQYKVAITNKGRLRLARRRFDKLTIPEPRDWDGRWRLVMFDIPEDYKHIRKVLTTKLQAMGFRLLQRSSWVHPFPCDDQIKIIRAAYPEIGPYILYAEMTYIDADAELRKIFARQLSDK